MRMGHEQGENIAVALFFHLSLQVNGTDVNVCTVFSPLSLAGQWHRRPLSSPRHGNASPMVSSPCCRLGIK